MDRPDMTDMELVDRVRYISSAFGTSNAEWISGGTSGEHVVGTSVLCCVTRFRRPTNRKSPETAPASVIAKTMANIKGNDS